MSVHRVPLPVPLLSPANLSSALCGLFSLVAITVSRRRSFARTLFQPVAYCVTAAPKSLIHMGRIRIGCDALRRSITLVAPGNAYKFNIDDGADR